jgi:hypothetical protein
VEALKTIHEAYLADGLAGQNNVEAANRAIHSFMQARSDLTCNKTDTPAPTDWQQWLDYVAQQLQLTLVVCIAQ